MRFILIALVLVMSGCKTVTREEIDVTLWINNAPLPAEICSQPGADRYGFYRKLDTGKIEFMSWCKPESRQWVSIQKDELERLLNKAGIKKRK